LRLLVKFSDGTGRVSNERWRGRLIADGSRPRLAAGLRLVALAAKYRPVVSRDEGHPPELPAAGAGGWVHLAGGAAAEAGRASVADVAGVGRAVGLSSVPA